MTVDALFTPCSIGPLQLPNRLAVAPMTRTSATTEGCATQQMADYYGDFARGGFGLLIVEGTFIDDQESQGYLTQPGIVTPAQVEAWKPLVEQAHSRIDRRYRQPESLGNWPQIDERRGSHPTGSMHVPCEHGRPHNSTFPSPFHAYTHGSLNETYQRRKFRGNAGRVSNFEEPPATPQPS